MATTISMIGFAIIIPHNDENAPPTVDRIGDIFPTNPIVSANVLILLIAIAVCPTCPIIPTKLAHGDNTGDTAKLISSQPALSWSIQVLWSTSSFANCCNWPSY